MIASHALAERAAFAFGRFATALDGLLPGELAVPIEGFHDLPARLSQLVGARDADRVGRRAEVEADCDAVLGLGEAVAGARAASGAAPERVVHNDCKINNLLFDADDTPLCIVDLDTVMAGPLQVDFGELVRTATCSAAEDERDLTRVDFDRERFEALARGYVAGVAGLADADECAALWIGAPWMAVENAARFLADHLDGDRYFPARRPDHNLARARAQLHLAGQFWSARDDLRRGVEASAASGARCGVAQSPAARC